MRIGVVLGEVYADVVNPNSGANGKVNGVLSVVEKRDGVYIEWKPSEIVPPTAVESATNAANVANAEEEDGESWVMAEDGNNLLSAARTPPPTKALGLGYNALVFSADVKWLRSFVFEDPINGIASVKFICKDGTDSHVLHFNSGGYQQFVEHLQKCVNFASVLASFRRVLQVSRSHTKLQRAQSRRGH